MAQFLSTLRRFLTRHPKAGAYEPLNTNFSRFEEGDVVIVNGRHPLLTAPLGKNKSTGVSRGSIEHNDIIGKAPRDLVQARKGPQYRITFPTLEEYATLSPRLVTPVYPADASLIVSLLDIHVPSPVNDGMLGEPLEILEAGTGHGSLTLHLSRAINGANSCPPRIPRRLRRDTVSQNDNKSVLKNEESLVSGGIEPSQQAWNAWRSQRRAIIHTIEVSAKHSTHAEKIVRGFRRGMYAGNVDFYVSSVEEWIENENRRRKKPLLSDTPKPYLSYVILDMPSAHLRIPNVSPILKVDGLLAVFMPNVTQIGDCVKIIKDKRLPLRMEKAVELGTGISNGRLWDIRMAIRRSKPVPASEEAEKTQPGKEKNEEVSDITSQDAVAAIGPEEPRAGDPVLVCRPKVGDRIVGGGFIGLWRRIAEE
ncbi:hypothetical protein LOZ53_002700 [Ophidiomyces ophidiicola]|nr:hypothetical protein LOZ55_003050 [Ophidiomyces ophidiicola]KAI1988595.1 hypothetical protein LOZ51_005412 [Ophidiomyces ophidiicola]KAI1991984.1 hypothetical protein LOZ53_002700 [Ophidiomyces ophidiicola]KAI1992137.1 hypothetical protein LOZ54_001895 [Ophidiomyces ophidiicola]